MKCVLVTGAAGFIGSYLSERLLTANYKVVGVDNLSSGNKSNLRDIDTDPNFNFFEFDINNTEKLVSVIRSFDVSEIWHLAANTDIISSHNDPFRDFKDSAQGTVSVLEAMRMTETKRIIFASSGSVYGSLGRNESVSEETGPLIPLSTYGAGKLAAEAFIGAYSNLYGMRAFIFRFGNVLGDRLTHGVIYDFVRKLLENPKELEILGDGTQEKNYFTVHDCIDGMLFIVSTQIDRDPGATILNLGNTGLTNVKRIAELVISAGNYEDVRVSIEGKQLAWPGDQPIIRLNTEKSSSLGWSCRVTSDDAVFKTAKEMFDLAKSESSG
jgi:UDP-glucose 4-epimerase